MKDARILHGWIEGINNQNVSVRVLKAMPLEVKDQFFFHVFGLEEDAKFFGRYSSTSELQEQGVTQTVCHFSIEGEIKLTQSSGVARLVKPGMTAMATYEEEPLLVEPTEVLDASLKGIGIALPIQVKKGKLVEVVVSTSLGDINMKTVVRNVRQGDNGFYRHGLEIEEMHRIDSLRWAQFFKAMG